LHWTGAQEIQTAFTTQPHRFQTDGIRKPFAVKAVRDGENAEVTTVDWIVCNLPRPEINERPAVKRQCPVPFISLRIYITLCTADCVVW